MVFAFCMVYRKQVYPQYGTRIKESYILILFGTKNNHGNTKTITHKNTGMQTLRIWWKNKVTQNMQVYSIQLFKYRRI